MKNIIVTGAASMLGVAVIKEAISQGKKAAAVVRGGSSNNSGVCALAGANLEIIECGLQNYDSLNFDARYDAFIHLAWQSTGHTARDDTYAHAQNILYALDAVNAAARAGCKAFVGAGSQAEYGIVSEKLAADTPCNPESAYGTAKYAAGKMARLAAERLGMRSSHARILSAYGEGMSDSSLIMYVIKTLLAGGAPALTKCEQLWDFIYAGDAARALLAIAERGADGKTYPIGSGTAKPLRGYVEEIRDIINPSIELNFGKKDYYAHQPMYLCADISELCHDTGFAPEVDFAQGIYKTVDWVKTYMPRSEK